MKRLLLNNKTIMVILAAAIFIAAYFMGREGYQEALPEEQEVEDYTAMEQAEEEPFAAQMPEKDEITIPTPADKTVAQEVAAEFVMAFHSVDAKNPYQYLADSKPYMTESAFKKYDNIPKRGTLETQKLTPTATDLLPVDLTDSMQLWRVGVTSQKEDGEYVFTEYLIEMVKDGQSWEVDGVSINE